MTIRELVERFCIQKLANILWECLEFSGTNRAEVDWLTAENFVKNNPQLVDPVFQRFLSQIGEQSKFFDYGAGSLKVLSFDASYETFVARCGSMVWNLMYKPFRRSSELIPNYYVPR